MLPRDERIGTADFRRAFEGGQAVRSKFLQVRFLRRAARSETPRAAFVVTKKTGKATVRNRLRRRLREIYRLSVWRTDARLARTDLLIFAGNAALSQTNDALEKELNELLERVAKNLRRAASETKSRDEVPKTSAPDIADTSPKIVRQLIRRFGSRASVVSKIQLQVPETENDAPLDVISS